MKTSPLRVGTAVCIVATSFCFVLGMFVVFLTDKSAAQREFIE